MTSLTDQQQEAVFSVDKNVLVSAGAGSGKTHVLVERYIEILRNDPELSTDNLIAVTFTRKAAGEMRSRLKRRFKELVSQGENSERWQSCLFEIDSARIGTIHSLCEAILRAFPAESKVDPNFEIIDEVSQAELIDESIEQAFREIVMAASPELELLELLNIDDIRRWLRQILKSSSQFIESANRLFGLDDAQLLTRLNETRSLVQARLMRDLISQPRWRSALSALDQLSFNGKLEEQRIEIVAAARLVETIDRSTSGTIIGWPGPVRECSSELPVSQDRLLIDSEQATDSSLELDAVAGLWLNLETISSANLRIGGNSDVAKEIKNAMRTMRELVQDVAGKTPLPAVISTSDLAQLEPERLLHSLFLRTKALFQDKKREDHKLDYDDLIHLAYESLSHPGSISRQYFQDRVRAILVDEFQDTNKLQSALVSLFASQRTRLFLIGDDKQSIYKFQGADVSNFNEWKEFIEGRKDEIYGLVSPAEERLSTSLNRSFRSHPQVVDFINLVFSNLMEDSTEDASYRASFQSLEPQRKPAAHTDPIEDATGSVEAIAIIDMPAEQASLPNDPAVAASEVPARVLPEITEKSARKGAARKSVRETSVVQLSLFASFANLQDEESGPVFDCAPEPSDRSLEVVPVLANAFSVVQNDKSASLAASVSESGEPNEVQPFRVTEVADETASSDEATQLFEPVQIVVTANDEESPSGDADKLHEARCVAQWIAEMVRGSAPIFNSDGTRSRSITYGDCAVLVPKNSDFEDLELALAELNIPFITFAGRGFLHRQEILDLENLLYFLGNSADNHALFGVLRSPLFAVSDDILHEVCTANEVRRLDTNLWTYLQGLDICRDGYEALKEAVHLLKRFIDDSSRMTPASLLRSIIQKTGYDTVLMSIRGGRQRSRNLWKLVSLAREHEELSCYEFAVQMSRMREFDIKQSDAPLESSDSVKLMTIHASKGLEFPVVALPALSGPISQGSGRLLYHRNYGVALNTARTEKDEPSAWYRFASLMERDMEIAERKRLLYVAMTRARDYLGVFLQRAGANRTSFKSWITNVLNLDLDDDTQELGLRHTMSGGFKAQYHLSTSELSPVLVSNPADQVSSRAEIKPDLRLIQEILETPQVFKSAWSGWSRVTPGQTGDSTLDATTIGVYFHTIMESMPPSLVRPTRETLESLALNLGSSTAHPSSLKALLTEGSALLDIFYHSDFFKLLLNARSRFSEVPYWILGEESIQSRRPDLLVESGTGEWFVIDYKTDHVSENTIAKQARVHLNQLATYVSDLETLTRFNLIPAVYFARLGVLYDYRNMVPGQVGTTAPVS